MCGHGWTCLLPPGAGGVPRSFARSGSWHSPKCHHSGTNSGPQSLRLQPRWAGISATGPISARRDIGSVVVGPPAVGDRGAGAVAELGLLGAGGQGGGDVVPAGVVVAG